MNFSRIQDCIDVPKMQQSNISVISVGGSMGLLCNLVRCGAQSFDLYDFDTVSLENLPRQAHSFPCIGMPKVDAARIEMQRINPGVQVRGFRSDITTMSDIEIEEAFSDTDLLINATDSFAAHAAGNRIALRLGIPSLFIGLYPEGAAGEIVFWHPDLKACYRCLCPSRYKAHERAATEGTSLDPSSHGCTIFGITQLDAIAGEIAVGLLTRGADNRYGRLIEQLGNRNFIQLQLDAEWSLNGQNPVRKKLGVSPNNPAYFSWNAIALSDPDHGNLYCPDCENYRGHCFGFIHGLSVRLGFPSTPVANVQPTPTDGGDHVS